MQDTQACRRDKNALSLSLRVQAAAQTLSGPQAVCVGGFEAWCTSTETNLTLSPEHCPLPSHPWHVHEAGKALDAASTRCRMKFDPPLRRTASSRSWPSQAQADVWTSGGSWHESAVMTWCHLALWGQRGLRKHHRHRACGGQRGRAAHLQHIGPPLWAALAHVRKSTEVFASSCC